MHCACVCLCYYVVLIKKCKIHEGRDCAHLYAYTVVTDTLSSAQHVVAAQNTVFEFMNIIVLGCLLLWGQKVSLILYFVQHVM